MFLGRSTGAVAARKREIKAWVGEALGLSEAVTIMVTELACREPGCPPVETVIAVLDEPKNIRQFKLHRPVMELDKPTVVALVRGHVVHDEDDDDVPPLEIRNDQD